MAQQQQQQQTKFFEGFQKYLPSIQWALTIIVAIAVFVLSFKDGQTSQAAQIQDLRSSVEQLKARQSELKTARDKQIDELRADLVTKQNLQDKFDTLLKLQELTREDVKGLRDEIQRSRMYDK